jgi:hypothetical protein
MILYAESYSIDEGCAFCCFLTVFPLRRIRDILKSFFCCACHSIALDSRGIRRIHIDHVDLTNSLVTELRSQDILVKSMRVPVTTCFGLGITLWGVFVTIRVVRFLRLPILQFRAMILALSYV